MERLQGSEIRVLLLEAERLIIFKQLLGVWNSLNIYRRLGVGSFGPALTRAIRND